VLTREQLIAMQRSLEERQVLSIYLDGRASDPASRRAWHAWLVATMASLRATLTGDAATLRDFDRCAEHLTSALVGVTGALRSKGWVAFVSSDGVALAEPVPVLVPNVVRWTRGAWVSPYIRAQKELRPVLLAVVDARSARVYRYALGVLTPLETFHAHAPGFEPLHMGSAPRPHFHPGTRGTTGADAAERARRDGTERMLREVVERLSQLAVDDAWILIGGMPGASRETLAMLPDGLRSRASLAAGLSRMTPSSSLRQAAAAGAQRLRRALDADVVQIVLGHAGDDARDSVGELDTRAALALGGVHMLLLSVAFTERHPDAAEQMTRLALGQQAVVEIVAGGGAERLDAVGGTGAILRFPTPRLRPALDVDTESLTT